MSFIGRLIIRETLVGASVIDAPGWLLISVCLIAPGLIIVINLRSGILFIWDGVVKVIIEDNVVLKK